MRRRLSVLAAVAVVASLLGVAGQPAQAQAATPDPEVRTVTAEGPGPAGGVDPEVTVETVPGSGSESADPEFTAEVLPEGPGRRETSTRR